MNIQKLINKKFFKNTGLFNIRSFVIVFTVYSLISIWSANFIAHQDQKLDMLFSEIKVLKSKYVYTKTILMNKRKYSNLLKKGEEFDFFQADTLIKTIYLEHED